jgi:REP element-mobilizing transposase RayT
LFYYPRSMSYEISEDHAHVVISSPPRYSIYKVEGL